MHLRERLHVTQIDFQVILAITGGRSPKGGIVVVGGILRAIIVAVVARGRSRSSEGEVLPCGKIANRAWQYAVVGGLDLFNLAIRGEVEFVDTDLAIEAVGGLWDVMAVIHDVVFVAVLQDAMVTRTVDSLVFVGFKDAALILIRSHRPHRACGILHTIGVIVARAGGIGEIVDAVALQHKRCLEEVLDLGIQDELLVGKRLHVGIELCYTAAEAVVDAPRTEIDVDLAVVVDEGLAVEGDGVMNKAVLDEYGVIAAQHVLPRAERRWPHAFMQHTRLTVEVAILSIGGLHHIRCPYHFCRRPVHDMIRPSAKVFRRPHLSRSVAVARAVGGGI